MGSPVPSPSVLPLFSRPGLPLLPTQLRTPRQSLRKGVGDKRRDGPCQKSLSSPSPGPFLPPTHPCRHNPSLLDQGERSEVSKGRKRNCSRWVLGAERHSSILWPTPRCVGTLWPQPGISSMAGRAGGQGPGEQVCRPQLRILCVLLLSLGFCRSVPSGEAQPNACLVGSALLGTHEGSLNCPTQASEGKLRHCTQSQRPVSQTLESLEWSGRIKAVLTKRLIL